MNLNLVDNASEKRYETIIDGSTAFIEYSKTQNKIYLNHIEVPIAHEGKGIGSALVFKVLEDIERQNLMLIPHCPFVKHYLKRHPEWQKLVMKGINIGE